jgi:hypothetical protein
VKDELTALQQAWPDLVARCELLQPALKRLLRDSWPVQVSDTVLTIGFDPEFATEVEEVKALDHGALHNMFSELLGRSIRVDYTRLRKPVGWSHTAGKENGMEPDTEEDFDPERAGRDPRKWQQHPAVRQVLEVFNGDVIDVQPPIQTLKET